MTREEINKFLADTKVYVAGKSEEIQKKLFSFGYKWASGNIEVDNIDYPFLFIYPNMSFAIGRSMTHFSDHENKEILVEDILSLELTEPTYRPFKNIEECWNEMLKHQPFAWVKRKDSKIYENFCYVGDHSAAGVSFDRAYNNYTFADGTPFGIKEE